MGGEPPGYGRPRLTLADLRRWEDGGATWRVFELREDGVAVELCTCFGEPVDVLEGDAPELLEYVRARARASSDS